MQKIRLTIQKFELQLLIYRIVEFFKNYARLVEVVDTSDLKFDSFIEYRFKSGNEYIKQFITKMMELVDMLGLGSSSF